MSFCYFFILFIFDSGAFFFQKKTIIQLFNLHAGKRKALPRKRAPPINEKAVRGDAVRSMYFQSQLFQQRQSINTEFVIMRSEKTDIRGALKASQ